MSPSAQAAVTARPYEVSRKPAAVSRLPDAPAGWSNEEILRSIRRWAELHGGPPITSDWEPARARARGEAWRVERYERGTWPTLRVVRQRFGRFNAAVEAAGFTPNHAPKRIRRGLSGADQVLAAVREWTRRYGDVPAQADWDPVRARRMHQEWRIARYEAGDWPSMRTAALHFGSFSGAIRAAGLEARDGWESAEEGAQRRASNRDALVAQRSAGAGAAGSTGLALAVRAVAAAKDAEDPEALHVALLELAATATRWAGSLGGEV